MPAITDTSPDRRRSSVDVAGPGLIALLVVQLIIGYEWLSSGIAKVASGTFASGLAADLKASSGDAAHWYKSFLDGTVIPNGRLFGVLVEIGELVVGVGLIAAAIVWLVHWSRISDRGRVAILIVTMLSALGATFMALNFHLASGASHPWLIPKEGFDGTIDVDAVLVILQMVLFAFSGYVLNRIRREHRVPSTTRRGLAPAAS